MARGGFYKTDLHRKVVLHERSGWHTFSPQNPSQYAHAKHPLGGVPEGWNVGIRLDLRPLAMALGEIPDKVIQGEMLRAAMMQTLAILKKYYQERLVVWTGINASAAGRLNKGVRTYARTMPGITGTYVIRDRYLSITREYFNAGYSSRYGQPGGLVRMGRPTIWPGVHHTAWGRAQWTKKSFMLKGKKPAWFRYPGAKKYPLVRVWGPNPAKELGVHHKNEAQTILRYTALKHFNPQLGIAYEAAVLQVKAKYGL